MEKPKTLQQVIKYFANEDNCVRTVAEMRWPDGVACPACGHRQHYYLAKQRRWKCKECWKQFSCKLGTIFEDSPISLDKWLIAIWMLVNCKNGISSYELSRTVGVTQKSAWFMLHRIRLALKSGNLDKMGGKGFEVEADETFVGAKAITMHKSRKVKIMQARELGNQVVNEIDKLMQAWEQRIRLGNLRLADRFLNFELNIMLHLRFDSGEMGILCFEQIGTREPMRGEQEIVCHGKQGTVLVDVIKLVDSPERIIPTFVWFQPINDLDGLGKHSLYFSSLVGFVFLDSLCDGKLNLPQLDGSEWNDRSTGHANGNKLLCKVVKSRPEIMNNIARHSDHVKGKSRDLLKVIRGQHGHGVGRDTRIWIGSEDCSVFEGQNFGCEIMQMLLGPFHLHLNKNEPIEGIESVFNDHHQSRNSKIARVSPFGNVKRNPDPQVPCCGISESSAYSNEQPDKSENVIKERISPSRLSDVEITKPSSLVTLDTKPVIVPFTFPSADTNIQRDLRRSVTSRCKIRSASSREIMLELMVCALGEEEGRYWFENLCKSDAKPRPVKKERKRKGRVS